MYTCKDYLSLSKGLGPTPPVYVSLSHCHVKIKQ